MFVLLATFGICLLGVYNYTRLAIDAVPDITNVQVQINTEAVGYSPLEVEQRITYPIETVMTGLPNLVYSRSLSRYGLSQVTVVFKEKTDIYFARQLVNERIQEVKDQLPSGIMPLMGPISTGLGEIFMWSVHAKKGALKENGEPYTPMDLRELQDWVIKPQLRNVKGVTEVNTIGGYDKQYHVTPYPDKLVAYGLNFHDIVQALLKNNSNIGAGYIEKNGEQYLIRSPGQVKKTSEIEKIVIKNHKGIPVHVGDVAKVLLGKEQRTGAGTHNGKEAVIGTVFMLIGENSRVVSKNVAEKMKIINKTLPKGVVAETTYDRTVLVDKAISTVKNNLTEGALLVIIILFLFLGNIRAAFLAALVIPITMLMTVTGMVENKISGNLMSLGALDFGMIVDGAVIIIENCISRLASKQKELGRTLSTKERFEVVFKASKEVRKATMFGELIIMIVYLPILTLTGVEGKMFTPMAFTVVTALGCAMILSLTFIPAAVAIVLTGKVSEKDNFVVTWSKKLYRPVFEMAYKWKKTSLWLAVFAVFLCLFIGSRMGSEFIPNLDEGDIALQAMRIPGTSLTQSIEMQKIVENEILKVPEVKTIFAKLGTAEVASDPMPPNIADTFVMLKPKKDWPNENLSKDDVLAKIREKIEVLPGNKYEFTQPIQMRFNELISGVRADVAVKVFGDDMDVMLKTAQDISGVISKIKGAKDVSVEQVTGLPVLTVKIDRDKLARTGLNISDIQEVLEIAVGGKSTGKIYEGDRRFELVVRMPEEIRQNIEELSRIPISIPEHEDIRGGDDGGVKGISQYITLGSISDLNLTPGPNQISRENGKRRIVVSANVRGRDIGSFVEEAQEELSKKVSIPPGYWTSWGGQFEQMISAAKRLKLVVPLSLLLIFVLLYTTFGNVKDSLIVFTGVPLALTGGILSIWVRGIPLSISAGVGFIALSGVAVLNGLVMISFINSLRSEGLPLDEAIKKGALSRLRPVLMTALTDIFGFLPMMFSTGAGAEVQKPLATVVSGGVLSSTLLTLIVLPVLYRLVHKDQKIEDNGK